MCTAGFTEGAALNAQVILYDPLRQTIGIPQTAIGFGKETASAALETKPVGRSGLYYVALSLKDMMNSTSGRVFKTEIIVEVLSGS